MLSLKQLAINSLNDSDLRLYLKVFTRMSENFYHDILCSEIVFDQFVYKIKCGVPPIGLTVTEMINKIWRRVLIGDCLIERIDAHFHSGIHSEFIYERRREITVQEQNFCKFITFLDDISTVHQYKPDNGHQIEPEREPRNEPRVDHGNISDNGEQIKPADEYWIEPKNEHRKKPMNGHPNETQQQNSHFVHTVQSEQRQPFRIVMHPAKSSFIAGTLNLLPHQMCKRVTITIKVSTVYPFVVFYQISVLLSLASDSIYGSFDEPKERNWKKRRKNGSEHFQSVTKIIIFGKKDDLVFIWTDFQTIPTAQTLIFER